MRKLAVGSRVTRHAEVVKLAGIFFVHENAGFSFGAMSIEVKLAHLRLFIDASGMSEGTFVFRLLRRKWKGRRVGSGKEGRGKKGKKDDE